MSYQDRIYRQSGVIVERNTTSQIVRTSSDISEFNTPLFTMNGASKINCTSLSTTLNFDAEDFLPTLRTCYSASSVSGTCFNSVDWYTEIYENNELIYSNLFYSSDLSYINQPTNVEFSGSVNTAFDTLGYTYTTSGLTYTINQPTSLLDITVKSVINIAENCPLTGSSLGLTYAGSCDYSLDLANLDFSGLTLNDENVYVINGETLLPFNLQFTGNTEYFSNDNAAKFKFEVYKYDKTQNIFRLPSLYTSPYYEWSTLSATSATTIQIPTRNIEPDGDYLIKGYYIHNLATEFALKLGKFNDTSKIKRGDLYGLYEPINDFHFVILNENESPVINESELMMTTINSLTVSSIELSENQTNVLIPYSTGDYIIALNGSTLAKDDDYTLTGVSVNTGIEQTLYLNGDIYAGDMLTIAYVNTGVFSKLKTEVFDIQNNIVSGTTNNQGSNKIYYNTTTNKYEIYTSLSIINNNDIGLTLNGVTLANGIDYYISSSNSNRIIFEGELIVNDIINVYYNAGLTVEGIVQSATPIISWSINKQPTNINDKFVLELATDSLFANIINSKTIYHDLDRVFYSSPIELIGNYGTKLYYRVRNIKNYKTICNDNLVLTKNSQVVSITVGTNTTNNY